MTGKLIFQIVGTIIQLILHTATMFVMYSGLSAANDPTIHKALVTIEVTLVVLSVIWIFWLIWDHR